jgi:hypothetical protein
MDMRRNLLDMTPPPEGLQGFANLRVKRLHPSLGDTNSHNNPQMHICVHTLIPAGGLSLNHTTWIHPRYRFFLPRGILSRVFRGKFVAGLKHAFRTGELLLPGALQSLADEKAFNAFLRTLYRHDWVVHVKPPFGGPQYVLKYLAHYTHRVAISNHRLISLTEGKVTFRRRNL